VLVLQMRIPMAVQGGEPSGGERFVDRRPILDPWVSLRDLGGEAAERSAEPFVEERSVTGAAAVVQQPSYWSDAELPKTFQPLVTPTPIALFGIVGRCALPKNWEAHSSRAELGDEIKIPHPGVMTRRAELITIRVRHAIDGAFGACPKFQLVQCRSTRRIGGPKRPRDNID
jgi:hypothetical protein